MNKVYLAELQSSMAHVGTLPCCTTARATPANQVNNRYYDSYSPRFFLEFSGHVLIANQNCLLMVVIELTLFHLESTNSLSELEIQY